MLASRQLRLSEWGAKINPACKVKVIRLLETILKVPGADWTDKDTVDARAGKKLSGKIGDRS